MIQKEQEAVTLNSIIEDKMKIEVEETILLDTIVEEVEIEAIHMTNQIQEVYTEVARNMSKDIDE
jgi:hypothetical protein